MRFRHDLPGLCFIDLAGEAFVCNRGAGRPPWGVSLRSAPGPGPLSSICHGCAAETAPIQAVTSSMMAAAAASASAGAALAFPGLDLALALGLGLAFHLTLDIQIALKGDICRGWLL